MTTVRLCFPNRNYEKQNRNLSNTISKRIRGYLGSLETRRQLDDWIRLTLLDAICRELIPVNNQTASVRHKE